MSVRLLFAALGTVALLSTGIAQRGTRVPETAKRKVNRVLETGRCQGPAR